MVKFLLSRFVTFMFVSVLVSAPLFVTVKEDFAKARISSLSLSRKVDSQGSEIWKVFKLVWESGRSQAIRVWGVFGSGRKREPAVVVVDTIGPGMQFAIDDWTT